MRTLDVARGVRESFKRAVSLSSYMRHVITYKGEDGYWVAECPTLPGCVSQGKTIDEALKNIKEAVKAYIEALERDRLPVPPETQGILVAEV